MKLYMACLREYAGTSTPCRILARTYLDCRMNKYVCFLDFSIYAAELDVSQKRFDGERRLEEPWASKSR